MLARYGRKLSALLVLLLVFTSINSALAEERRFFPESQQAMKGKLLDYWNQNGGLPVFGYPVTSQRLETIVSFTGETKFVSQWVERNRLEIHPENAGTPYEVLLGLLGKERLSQLGREIEPREAGPVEGCLWFEQTGHNVCNQAGNLGFKSYWQSHGLKIDGLDTYARSLQLFGLPLTSAQTETNANGDTVVTQWFERARLEWHPNNPDQFKVLLGLLGNEVRGINTAPRTDCDGVRQPDAAEWQDSNCVAFGKSLTLNAHGFAPNEEVFAYVADRDYRSAFVGETWRGLFADANGNIQVPVNTTDWFGDELGPQNYRLQISNNDGSHLILAPFRVLP